MPTFLQLRTSLLGEEDYDRMVDRLGSPSAVRRHYGQNAGVSQRLDQTIARSQASTKGREEGKMYHKVPFHQRDDAKKEGMRWDSNAKKWYHTSAAASSSSKFHKEEVELKEKHLTPAEMSKREEIAKAMERKHPGMDKAKKMAIATATAKRVAEESEQIDELKSSTLMRYAGKAEKNASDHLSAARFHWERGDKEADDKSYMKANSRFAGAMKAKQKVAQRLAKEDTDLEEGQFWGNDKMAKEAEKASGSTSTVRGRDAKGTYTATYERKKGEKESKETSRVYDTKEEVVSELSTDLLGRYKKAAGAAASAANKAANTLLANKRFKGIIKATKKQFANDAKKTNEESGQIDELKKSTLASYTNKVVDPVYGIPRSTKKLKQRLAGLQRAHQRVIGKAPVSETTATTMSPADEKKMFVKVKPQRASGVAKALK